MGSEQALPPPSVDTGHDSFDDDVDFGAFFPPGQWSESATRQQAIDGGAEKQMTEKPSLAAVVPIPVPPNPEGYDSFEDENAPVPELINPVYGNPAWRLTGGADNSSESGAGPAQVLDPCSVIQHGSSSAAKPNPVPHDNGISSTVKPVERNPEIDAAKIRSIVNGNIPAEHSALINHTLLQAHKESIKAATVHIWAAAHGYSVDGAEELIYNWDRKNRAAFEAATYAELNLAIGTPLQARPVSTVFSGASVPTSATRALRKRHVSTSSVSSTSSVPKRTRHCFTDDDRKLMLDAAKKAFRTDPTLTVKAVMHVDFAERFIKDHPHFNHTPGSIAKHYSRKMDKKLKELREEY